MVKLEVVKKEKDLGIMISSDLKREKQCRYAANKAKKSTKNGKENNQK